MAEEHKHGTMDITVQEKTFAGFVRVMTWTAVLIVLVVETIIGSICVYVVAPFAFSKAVEVAPADLL